MDTRSRYSTPARQPQLDLQPGEPVLFCDLFQSYTNSHPSSPPINLPEMTTMATADCGLTGTSTEYTCQDLEAAAALLDLHRRRGRAGQGTAKQCPTRTLPTRLTRNGGSGRGAEAGNPSTSRQVERKRVYLSPTFRAKKQKTNERRAKQDETNKNTTKGMGSAVQNEKKPSQQNSAKDSTAKENVATVEAEHAPKVQGDEPQEKEEGPEPRRSSTLRDKALGKAKLGVASSAENGSCSSRLWLWKWNIIGSLSVH